MLGKSKKMYITSFANINVIPKFQHRQFILRNFEAILYMKAKEKSVINHCKYGFSVHFVKDR